MRSPVARSWRADGTARTMDIGDDHHWANIDHYLRRPLLRRHYCDAIPATIITGADYHASTFEFSYDA